MPKHIAYLRPYEKNGHTRIWIEGSRVAAAGFAAGDRYAVHYSADQIELRRTDGIGKKVHGKKKNGGTWPIIDIFNAAVDGSFKGAKRLRAEFTLGSIKISLAAISKAAMGRVQRLLNSSSSGQALTVGSLFHGLGVLDHAIHQGLESVGVKVELSFAVERESANLDASLANNPVWNAEAKAILADIDDIDPGELPPVDILVAGIPCSGASIAGRTALKLKAPEFHEVVGHLFVPFLRVVETTQPGIVLIENVPGYADSVSLSVIRRALANLGYEMELTELAGDAFGALEARRRMVAIARSVGMPAVLPRLHANSASNLTLGDILDDISLDSAMWQTYDHVHKKIAKDSLKPNNGFKLNLFGPEATTIPTIVKGYAETKSWQPFLRHPITPGLMRKFTAGEHARIKAIPEQLIAGLPQTVAHALLGQSVIHPVFCAVGQAIGETIKAFRGQVGSAQHLDLFSAAA